MAKKNSRASEFGKMVLARHRKALPRRSQQRDRSDFPWAPLALWTAFSLVGGYVLFFSVALSVVRVEIHGESVIPAIEYQVLAETELEGTYFGLIQKRNYFFLPLKRIAASLLERYPKLSIVAVERSFPDGIRISLSESPVILLWCSGGPCYGLRDGDAVTLSHAEDSRYDTFRLSVIDESALSVELGGPLLVGRYLETFQLFRAGLPRIVGTAAKEVATTPSRHSGELALMTDEGWRVLVSVDRPVEMSLGTLQAFLGEYAKNHADRSKLAWVDLQVEGKVFFAEGEGIASASVVEGSGDPEKSVKPDEKKKDGE